MAQQDDFIRTALRVPPELHKALHSAATAGNRTFNAEIVSRLQQTFEARGATSDELAELRLELRQQKYLASRFEMVAETTDRVLAIAGGVLNQVVAQFPAADREHLVDETMAKIIAAWVVPDGQGAVRDFLTMLERADDVKDTLREFLTKLEERDGVDSAQHSARNTKVVKAVGRTILAATAPAEVNARQRKTILDDVDAVDPKKVSPALRTRRKLLIDASAPLNTAVPAVPVRRRTKLR